jgi:hypothetical protein
MRRDYGSRRFRNAERERGMTTTTTHEITVRLGTKTRHRAVFAMPEEGFEPLAGRPRDAAVPVAPYRRGVLRLIEGEVPARLDPFR